MGYRLNSSVSVKDICSWVDGATQHLSGHEVVSGISDFSRTEPDTLCAYVKGPVPRHYPGMVFLSKAPLEDLPCILVDNPQHAMNQTVRRFAKEIGFQSAVKNPGVHPSVEIGQYVVIEDDVEIGEGCVIEHHAVIHSGTRMGKNCLVRTHASVGGQGYSYYRDDSGKLHKQLGVGGVFMGDDVEIGSNTCIVRGNIFDTRLENGVKVDNLVYIAHDCHIGEESYIISGASLCGYVKTGKRVRVAPNASVRQHIRIQDGAVVGLGAVVVSGVEAGETVAGVPAKPMARRGTSWAA